MKQYKKLKDFTLQDLTDYCSKTHCMSCELCWGSVPNSTEKQCFLKSLEPYMWDCRNVAKKFNQEIIIDDEVEPDV